MAFEMVWFWLAAGVAGFVLQNVLHGSMRTIIYPLAFSLGFATNHFSNPLPAIFCLGMASVAAMGRYWLCLALEIALLVVGFAFAYLV